MKFSQHLLNAISGWLAGLVITILFSALWQSVFPVVERTGQGAGIVPVFTFIFAILTPITIAGGVIGGRLPREGGRVSQLLYAALLGALFSIPFACFLFWYTGW